MKNDIKIRSGEKISVKGAEYTIKWKQKIIDEGIVCWGLHDSEKKLILLSKELPKKEILSVFLHELFHAYLFECNIREGLSGSLEEVVVECLSKAIDFHFDLLWKE